jgi:hypothetical protein
MGELHNKQNDIVLPAIFMAIYFTDQASTNARRPVAHIYGGGILVTDVRMDLRLRYGIMPIFLFAVYQGFSLGSMRSKGR